MFQYDKDRMTAEEIKHFNELNQLGFHELTDLASQGDEMAQAMVTGQSASFATLTAQARMFEEVMTQTFRVRLKSELKCSLEVQSTTCIRQDFAQMGGKWFDCTIDWDNTLLLGRLVVKLVGGEFPDYSIFYAEDLTQLGTVRKMKALANFIISKQ